MIALIGTLGMYQRMNQRHQSASQTRPRLGRQQTTLPRQRQPDAAAMQHKQDRGSAQMRT